MKVQILVAFILACVALTQATFSTNELFARAAVEADASSAISADDVITHKDFSEEEYDALQQLSEEEFWSHLDEKLQEQSFLEKAKAEKKPAAKKPAAKKAAKPAKKVAKPAKKAANATKKPSNLPSGFTEADLLVGDAQGATPAEQKKPVLDAKLFENDDPYEFQLAHHVIPKPTNTDEVTARAAKYIKKLKKTLIKEGKLLYSEIFRLERRVKKFLDDEDWNNVKIIRRTLRFKSKAFKAWKLRKDSMEALQAAVGNIIDWETSSIATKSALQKDYVQERDAKTKQLRALVEQHIKKVELEQVKQMKAEAMKALRKDLSTLKGKAMENFVQRYKKALYKQFGQTVVDAAVAKGGLREVRKLAGDKAGELLLQVAAHLPTVGPYIRAGLISNKAGFSAYSFVSRW